MGTQKYKQSDVRNILERASARETAARVAGGALLKALLKALGVSVLSHVVQIASVRRRRREDPLAPEDFDAVDESPVRCLDPDATRAMVREIDELRRPTSRSEGSSRCRPSGCFPGRLTRLLGAAPRRASGDGDLLYPGDQGRLVR